MFKLFDRFSSPLRGGSFEIKGGASAFASPAAYRQRPHPPALLRDSIHHKLDEIRPNGTPTSSIQTLMARIREGLRPRFPMGNGRSRTMFEGIIADRGNLFSIKLPNGQNVTRTKEETELHILLQSQMRAVDPMWRDNGDSIDIQFLEHQVHAAALPVAPLQSSVETSLAARARRLRPTNPIHDLAPRTANATRPASGMQTTNPKPPPVHSDSGGLSHAGPSQAGATAKIGDGMPANIVQEFVDPYQATTRIYGAGVVNMETVNERLIGTSHLVKGISGANNDCWWRAALLSAILKSDPVALEQTVISRLGGDFRDDAAQLRRMGEAVRSEGVQRILTGMQMINLPADLERGSALKLPGYTDSQDAGRGEEVCRRIVNALLMRAGVPEDETISVVYDKRMGDMHHITALLNQLDCETVIFSKPWGNTYTHGRRNSFDPAISTVEICPRPGSCLSQIADDPSLSRRTENLLNELDGMPVLVCRGAHFDLAIPSATFYLARVRHPIQ